MTLSGMQKLSKDNKYPAHWSKGGQELPELSGDQMKVRKKRNEKIRNYEKTG